MSTGISDSRFPAYPGARPGLPSPPMPVGDTFEVARVEEQRRRRRLVDGTWRHDLEERLRRTMGTQRQRAWGQVSLALNPARNIWRELAVLYTKAPRVSHPQADVGPLTERLRLAGLWGLMPRVQTYTIGLREYLVRADVDERGRLRFRPVPPDLVVARARPEAPDIPVHVEELRPRPHPVTGKPVWTRDILSVEDPDNPVYEIREVRDDGKPGQDWTTDYLGSAQSGDDYPYRPSDPNLPPRIPYVLYHAQRTGDRLWDPWEGIELVEASLDLAVLHCFLLHVYRQASWPQRWIANLQVAGTSVMQTDEGRRSEVVTDPATVLQLETPDGDGESRGQPMVGQFDPGADVQKLEETLANLVARVAQDAGVPPSDVQRLGGTARSGVAISLTNEGKRAAQRRYQTHFRDTDERLMGLCALLLNRFGNLRTPLPEAGFEVAYQEIPLSPEELKARREHALELLNEGLMSRTQAYIEMNPGVSRQQAEADLAAFTRVQNSITPDAA